MKCNFVLCINNSSLLNKMTLVILLNGLALKVTCKSSCAASSGAYGWSLYKVNEWIFLFSQKAPSLLRLATGSTLVGRISTPLPAQAGVSESCLGVLVPSKDCSLFIPILAGEVIVRVGCEDGFVIHQPVNNSRHYRLVAYQL